MRLDIINRILIENKIDIKIINDNQGKVVLNGLNNLKLNIPKIEKTGVLLKEIEKIKTTNYYKVSKSSDSIIVSPVESKEIIKQITDFNILLKNLTITLSEILGKEPKNVLYIKLPETKNLNDISETINILEKAISQTIINDKINGSLEFLGVESGSSWIKICVGTSLAVSTVAGCFWSATIILQKMEELKQMEEQTKTLTIKNKNLEDISKYRNGLFDISLEIEAQNIAKNTLGKIENEEVERLKLSIKTFTELINKGIEVQPSLNEPIDVQQLFPVNENYKLLNTIKKLE